LFACLLSYIGAGAPAKSKRRNRPIIQSFIAVPGTRHPVLVVNHFNIFKPMHMKKACWVTLSLVCMVFVSTCLIQCKTTKADTRDAVDRSGDPDDFNDAIKKNAKELF
jgi:hypothetical protein